jgi:hypothetical protein
LVRSKPARTARVSISKSSEEKSGTAKVAASVPSTAASAAVLGVLLLMRNACSLWVLRYS